ncbi:hypothetical protein OG462_09150 [Streptomyces sp. NBC_01077]|uniref:hypothetical protein n=1 Tax=Streptomyces sp. NBC_01077 TaxID=2903746 RepID=UPI0038689462|nr:hypothetical protein OG462_09150 [Streptomyces sp. NBC_01077]
MNDQEESDPELPATTEPVGIDMFNMDYHAEHALDPDDDGYLFGTAMGRSDS